MLPDLSAKLTKGDEDIYRLVVQKIKCTGKESFRQTMYPVMCKPMPATDAAAVVEGERL